MKKAIYILDFGHYYAMQTGGLTFDRVGKSPLVRVTRNFEDLSFLQHFKMMLFGRIARYFLRKENIIHYEWCVMAGFEKVEWRKQQNGTYIPYDAMYNMELARTGQKEISMETEYEGLEKQYNRVKANEENAIYDKALEWAANWITGAQLSGHSEEVQEFARNMAMSIRAAKRGLTPRAVDVAHCLCGGEYYTDKVLGEVCCRCQAPRN